MVVQESSRRAVGIACVRLWTSPSTHAGNRSWSGEGRERDAQLSNNTSVCERESARQHSRAEQLKYTESIEKMDDIIGRASGRGRAYV